MADKKPVTAAQALGGLLVWGVIGLGIYACSQIPSGTGKSDEQTLADMKTWYVASRANSARLIVWKDKPSMDKGLAFISTGEASNHTAEMLELIACFADQGTKLISIDTGMFTSTVSVVSGPADGCEGVVDNSWLTHKKPEP